MRIISASTSGRWDVDRNPQYSDRPAEGRSQMKGAVSGWHVPTTTGVIREILTFLNELSSVPVTSWNTLKYEAQRQGL